MVSFGTLGSPQMLLLGTGYSSLGLPSLIGIFLTEQQILTWKLVSDLISTHLANGTEEVPGPVRNGGIFCSSTCSQNIKFRRGCLNIFC